QFQFGAFSREASQAAQRHLEVPRAQFLLVVIVAVFAFFPYFDSRAMAGRRAADTDSLGMVTAVSKCGRAARAYPFVAARVPFFLFFEPLLEELHEFVPTVLFDGCLFFRREVFLEFLDEPVERDLLVC